MKKKETRKSDKKENETKKIRQIKCSYEFPLNGGSEAGSQKKTEDPLDLSDNLSTHKQRKSPIFHCISLSRG